MKARHSINVVALAINLLAIVSAISAQPTPSTTTSRSHSEMAERAMHRRAVEAVIWGMPAVNYDLMYQAMVREAKGGFNQIAYWSRPAGLEDTNSDAEPRRDLPHTLHQHERHRTGST
jgi:hypothetical protein